MVAFRSTCIGTDREHVSTAFEGAMWGATWGDVVDDQTAAARAQVGNSLTDALDRS